MPGFMRSLPPHRPLLAAAFAAALALPTCAGAQVGGTLAQLQQTDFWRFFHFTQADTAWHDGASQIVTFRPGGRFRDQVKLNVIHDQDGRLYKMELDLARPFVTDAVNTVFARDVVKSFIRTAVPAADLPAVDTLANEIEFGAAAAPGMVQMRAGRAPALPAEPSAGYRAFLLQEPLYSVTLGHSRFGIQSILAPDGNDDLRIFAFDGTQPRQR